MTNLEHLADLLFDMIINLDPQEFDAIAGAVGRFKTEASLHGCPEFATLFGAIERAVIITDPTSSAQLTCPGSPTKTRLRQRRQLPVNQRLRPGR